MLQLLGFQGGIFLHLLRTASDKLTWGELFSGNPFSTKASAMIIVAPNVARVSWRCDSMKAV
jgi:hypothetical protein